MSITRLLAPLLLAVCVSGCTPAGTDSPDADGPHQSTDGAAPATLDPADCAAFARNASAANQACAGAPIDETAATRACQKGLASASLCGGSPAGGLACFRAPDPSDWVCQLGVTLPSCGGDLSAALGMYCLLALGNPECASGIRCNGALDCPTGAGCNQAIGQCFSDSATCIGLPCTSSLDCPTGETCNSAEHACVHQ